MEQEIILQLLNVSNSNSKVSNWLQ